MANSSGPLPSTYQGKLNELRAWMRRAESVLVCFSGGTDSALLLAVAHEQLGARAAALTAVSASLPAEEKVDASRIAQNLAIRHYWVETDELQSAEYVRNGEDRCFHCRARLFELAETKRAELGLRIIVSGTNQDDLSDFRPGNEAARQAGVQAPLVELGFDKATVRAAAAYLGLDTWDKPAAACLASRIPYGTAITEERLAQVGGFETALRALAFRQVRVRWHDRIARLELGQDEIERAASPELRSRLVELGRLHGFHYITLDLLGYRQGSHNEVLRGRSLPVLE
ncbi:ATP-dependent sacrificial sulfur transferase LarE [Myxococcota bacterium]